MASFAALLFASILGCETPPPPPPAEPEKPTCGLSYDTLAGKSFVLSKKEGGKTVEDIWARAQFYKDGDKLRVHYNTRAPTDMYSYLCVNSEKEITCWEDVDNADDWCRTLIANGQECTPEKVAELTGVKPDVAKAGYDEVQAELKKLPPKELEDMKKVFNQPNNQLRAVLHVKVNKDCNLTMSDRYQTMTYGQVREMENIVGSAHFVETTKDLVFEHCPEAKNLVALTAPGASAKPGETKLDWKPGEAIPFKYVGPDSVKAEDGCSYSQDTWVAFEPTGKAVPVQPDAKGKLDWSFSGTFAESTNGIGVAHQVRYKACNGGAPEKLGVSCQLVKLR